MQEDYEFIEQHKLFTGLSRDQLLQIRDLLQVNNYDIDDVICREGENANHIYIIREGEVDVTKQKENSEESYKIITLSTGAIIGEISFIIRSPHSATVTAVTPLKMLTLSFDELDAFKQDSHAERQLIYYKLIENIANELSMRICRTNQLLINVLHSSKTESDIRNAKMSLFAGFWSM